MKKRHSGTIGCLAVASAIACGSSESTNLGVTSDGGADGNTDAPLQAGRGDGSADVGDADAPNDNASVNVTADAETLAEGGDGDAASGDPNCGNGTLDPGEQCDDGNRFNLDGCDSACRFEVVTRMTLLSIQGTPAPAFCTPTTNRFGTQSVTSTGLGQLNPSVQNDVTSAATNTFIQFLGLPDLTGAANVSGLSLGFLSGQPDPAKGTWPGNNPVDWWFFADRTTVATSGRPSSLLSNGAIASRTLTAGPGDVNLPLALGGTPAVVRVRNAHIVATINASPAPDVPAAPPDKLATGLTVFQTITADGSDQGLCGNMTVESLANTPVPQVLTVGSTACSAVCIGSRSYTDCGANNPVGPGCNSWLDVLVGGCSVSGLCVAVVSPQEPDVAGLGTAAPLTLDPTTNKVPSAQTAGNSDAYSVYLKFDANRAHITGEHCAQTSDCQTGKTCVTGACQ